MGTTWELVMSGASVGAGRGLGSESWTSGQDSGVGGRTLRQRSGPNRMRLDEIPPQPNGKATYNVIIETSRGSRNKYSYDPELQTMRLKKVLPEGHVFPFDFGFIPQTKGEDGDPLDVLVMMDEPAFAGCVVECRMIGVLEATQSQAGKMIRNDRFIAVAADSLNFKRLKQIRDVEREMLEQVQHFFASYAEMGGKEFRVLKVAGVREAAKLIAAGRVKPR
jgi:inorganic pyrophosphatase